MISLPARQSEPDYTHAAHFKACYDDAQNFISGAPKHVLAKRGQIVYCAIIKNAYTVPNGPDCWTLETLWPEKVKITVPCRNVIACNSDFCSCAAKAATGAAQPPGVRLPAHQKGLTCL